MVRIIARTVKQTRIEDGSNRASQIGNWKTKSPPPDWEEKKITLSESQFFRQRHLSTPQAIFTIFKLQPEINQMIQKA